MMALVDKYYSQENAFDDAVVSKEDYERMKEGIGKSYEDLVKDVRSIAEKVGERNKIMEQEYEEALKTKVITAQQATRVELFIWLQT